MNRYVSWASSVLLALILAACGFQLSGLNPDAMRPYPFGSIYVDSTQPVAQQVIARLQLDKRVKLVNSADKADAVLRIVSENKIRDIQTIDRSGKTNEYRLNYVVIAQLRMHGEPVGKDIKLQQLRSMTYSDSAVLGKGMEEDLLWSDMSRTVAQNLLYRLTSDQMVKEAASVSAGVVAPASSAKASNAVSQP
jgi:LPS-assembly lipoprotein